MKAAPPSGYSVCRYATRSALSPAGSFAEDGRRSTTSRACARCRRGSRARVAKMPRSVGVSKSQAVCILPSTSCARPDRGTAPVVTQVPMSWRMIGFARIERRGCPCRCR